ncbi:MAG: YciI family protein [Solirubrobacteraceae bacterium]
MSTYLFSYRTPDQRTPPTPEGMAAWQSWFGVIGEDIVDGGNPTYESSTVGECGPETALGGYSVISADDLQAAVEMAAGCPLIARGGGVEVGEITPLSAESMTTTAADPARAGLAS